MNPHPTHFHLLLAVDGSEHASAAVQLISDLPLPKNCQFSIVSVLIPRNAQYHVVLEKVLDKTKEQLQEGSYQNIETQLLTGYPAEQIVAYAKEHHPDLIAMGARGLRSTLGILLGGIAQQVVEYAYCPVLVVRSPYQRINNILLATDGSDHSQYALRYLRECPLPADANIHVINVLPPELTPDAFAQPWHLSIDYSPLILTEQMQEQQVSQAQKEEKLAKDLLKNAVISLDTLNNPIKSVLRRGDAATEIINYASEAKIDIIVVGSRGLSEFRGWLLGGVSRKLVHYADCSILIVKNPENN